MFWITLKIFIIDIDDVNKALSEMTEELALKVAVREFREALND
jgi:hypothetical protein